MNKQNRGLIIAAPASGSGKTTITLGLLRALSRRGPVRGAKSGPDYIDPRFHEAACGVPCPNLDGWAMSGNRIAALAQGDGPLIVEAAMGLFDGAPPDGTGSAAQLAKTLDLPVVLVVDCAKAAQSIAALVKGFVTFDPDIRINGLILNKLGSARHERIVKQALAGCDLPPVLGAVPRQADLLHPSRHLGLVQAGERPDLEDFLNRAAVIIEECIDLESLVFSPIADAAHAPRLAPPAQKIAIAQDQAFAFTYPHIIDDWRAAGAEILPFSPLADDAVPEADFIFLPGGYPELHAGRIANNASFVNSMREASEYTDIYGECGGYMVLGDGLTDADGQRHQMLGLLQLETSFHARKLHLGYRRLDAQHGPFQGLYAGHEFHFATTLRAEGAPLFDAQDAEGEKLPPMGLRQGRICGSFAHVIDRILP
ncbi:MAG: cobyrinate a,c-diamide synthase [Litoreibacter sp.]|nr:cobyrinate a,c-diamide synthase [Litoreibacter sp.]